MSLITFQKPGELAALPPLSLYIHIPWCVRKCPYCDFNSHQAKSDLAEAAYIDALLLDLQTELPNIWGRPVETVFIGGGTPSLMSARTLDALLTGIRMLLPLDPLAEITLEANPGTVEAEKFAGFRAAVALDLVRVDQAERNEAVDWLRRIDRVPAGDRNACCRTHRLAALENAPDRLHRQRVHRHADDGQRHDRRAAHRIDV